MAGQSDQQGAQTGATAVPDLIDRYRLRRDAWIAQADELARLREEVRGSAEREAMEIVTAARRDVRKVITEARRELLVLSAQLQAALGEAIPRTDPAALLDKAGITPDPGARNILSATSVDTLAADDAVNEILNEVQADMTALAEDARALPLQAVPVRQIAAPPPALPIEAIRPSPARVVQSPALDAPIEISGDAPASLEPERVDTPGLSESASEVPPSSPFPSGSLPIRSGKPLHSLIAVLVGVGVTVAGITSWWLSSRNFSSESAVAPTSAPNDASSSVAGEPSSPATTDEESIARRSTSPAHLSLVAEAVRDVWIRTTIDGRSDGGRTLAAGQSIDISAERSISLRVGDAGAIVVSVNKEQKRSLGRDGEVVMRQFFAEGAADDARAPALQPASATAAPAPAPAPDTPFTPAPVLPPVPSSAPAIATRAPTPEAANIATADPPSPPAGTLAPAATPGPAAIPETNASSQLEVPNGAVNQFPVPAAPAAAPTSAPVPASPSVLVQAVARQWLDAYHRQDRATLAALSTDDLTLADERRADERFPAGMADVARTLDRLSVQIAADTAVLTAVMVEQLSGSSSPHVSPISQVWVFGGGQWKVRQARFVSEARLNQVFK